MKSCLLAILITFSVFSWGDNEILGTWVFSDPEVSITFLPSGRYYRIYSGRLVQYEAVGKYEFKSGHLKFIDRVYISVKAATFEDLTQSEDESFHFLKECLKDYRGEIANVRLDVSECENSRYKTDRYFGGQPLKTAFDGDEFTVAEKRNIFGDIIDFPLDLDSIEFFLMRFELSEDVFKRVKISESKKKYIREKTQLRGKAAVVEVEPSGRSTPFTSNDFVTVSSLPGIEVQKHELTFGQWAVLNSKLPNKHQNPWEECLGRHFLVNGPNFPVACISWHDIQAFIAVLNSDPNRKYNYRLPESYEINKITHHTLDHFVTEAIAGSITGETVLRERKMMDHSHFNKTYGYGHSEVCSTKAARNGKLILGLCDVLGNVREWTSSGVYSCPECRYVSGGSFHKSEAPYVEKRSFGRYFYHTITEDIEDENDRVVDIGVRLVRELRKK